MEKDELTKIIEKIENETPKNKAFFGIHSMNDGDEAFIKANKYGLELFANELLKASQSANNVAKNQENNTITFDTETEWITGNIWLNYIEPKLEDRVDIKEKPYESIWKDKIVEYGCFTIIGIIILTFLVGIYAIINWFV